MNEALQFANIFPEPILILWGTGEVLCVNKAFTEMSGAPNEVIRGTLLQELALNPPEELKQYLRECTGSAQFLVGRILLKNRGGATAYRCECGAVRPASPAAPALLMLRLQLHSEAITPFQLLNEQIGALSKEIVKRQKAEEEVRTLNLELEARVRQRTAELESSNQELRAFAYAIAHDLRGPIRGQRGLSDLLLSEHASTLPPDALDLLRRIQTSADEMQRLLDDLLDYSRVVLFAETTSAVNLDELCRSFLLLLASQIEASSAQLTITHPLGIAQGHPVLLRHALANLLANAFKFSKPGAHPVVRIFSEPSERTLRLCVEDQGIGIAPEYHERIFGIFQKLDCVSGGTGVGLAIVQRAAERMGGKVGLSSQPGHGSCFWIELPKANR